ncbi:MAG: hypothetical protein ABIQ31_07615 [Ferruginibacter sp.]
MYTEEQMEQFARDRAFIAEAYREQNAKKAAEFSKPLPATTTDSEMPGIANSPVQKYSNPNIAAYNYFTENRLFKIISMVCCVLILGTLFLQWFGGGPHPFTGFELGYTEWSPNVLQVFGPGFKVGFFILIISLGFILFSALLPEKKYPIPADVFFGFPAIAILTFLLSTYLTAFYFKQQNAITLYGAGFWIALFLSGFLLVIGQLIRIKSRAAAFKLSPDRWTARIKQNFYYLVIFIGIAYACITWPLSNVSTGYLINHNPLLPFSWFLENATPILKIAWPYFVCATIIWLSFSHYHFVRVWFYLIALYAIFLMVMGLFWNTWPTAHEFTFGSFMPFIISWLHNIFPYIILYTVLSSYRIGKRRKCPSCQSIYGKKLLYSEYLGSSSSTYNATKHMSVGDYKSQGSYDSSKVYLKNDYDLVQIQTTETVTYHKYKTFNICKNCGHEWTNVEIGNGRVFGPM